MLDWSSWTQLPSVILEFWLSYPFDFSLFSKNVKDRTDFPIDEVTQIISYIIEASHQNVARSRFFSICNGERDVHSQQWEERFWEVYEVKLFWYCFVSWGHLGFFHVLRKQSNVNSKPALIHIVEVCVWLQISRSVVSFCGFDRSKTDCCDRIDKIYHNSGILAFK